MTYILMIAAIFAAAVTIRTIEDLADAAATRQDYDE